MIFKATKIKSVRHAGMLAKHLLRADENEMVDVLEIRGTARPEDLAASLRSMQRATDLTGGKTGLFSVAINPRDHEADKMTPQQWQRSLQALEEEFKLTGQPCAIVRHRKNDREHVHAVYQLTDTETGKLIDIKFDYRRCQALGRRLEREFRHEVTPMEPSRSSYTRNEQQQAKRLNQDILERRKELRSDLEQARGLDEFKKRLTEKGYALAKGDRAGVVLVDTKGEVFGLGRELGLKASEVKKLLGPEIDHLPTVDQVRTGSKSTETPIVKKGVAARQDDIGGGTVTAYQQNVTVSFNTSEFKAAQAAHRLDQQQREEQAERDKQERIAQRLKEWEEQQETRRQERNRNKGFDLDR